MVGANAQNHGRQREDIIEAAARLVGVDGARRRVFCDMQVRIARGLARTSVHVDGGGIIRQVCIIDAIARHAFTARPLPTLLGNLAQTVGELLRGFLEHLHLMLRAAVGVRHHGLGKLRRGPHEQQHLGFHASAAETQDVGGINAEASLHALAAGDRIQAARRNRCRRLHERRCFSLSAGLGLDAVACRHVGCHQARTQLILAGVGRTPALQPLSHIARAFGHIGHGMGIAQLDADDLAQAGALGTVAGAGDGRA